MNHATAAARAEKLRDEINRHRYLIHVLNREEISEAALDALKRELTQIEAAFPDLVTPDSPSQRVAGQPLEGFTKAPHAVRMLSLNDIFSSEELADWETRLANVLKSPGAIPGPGGYYAEVKLDGFAISLRYEDGVLVRAATRGDGSTGEEVTANIRTVEAIPLRLTEGGEAGLPVTLTEAHRLAYTSTIEVRGEVYITKADFAAINEEQAAQQLPLYANPRNLAAGSVRQLDPRVTAARRLRFFAYALIAPQLDVATHADEHTLLAALGLPVEPHSTSCPDRAAVERFLAHWQEARANLPYGTDGAVIQVNDRELAERLGTVGKAPRWAVAYKYAAEQTTTVIRKIDLQIGRTGAVTPVAVFDPVLLAGSTVSRATLHNADEIARKDIRVGDTVVIQKAGDVIPEVVQVLPALRPAGSHQFHYPDELNGVRLVRREGEVAYYVAVDGTAVEVVQEELLKRRLEHYASRGAMDITGLGEKAVARLVESGLVGSIADLYRLTVTQLQTVERFATLSAQNLCEAIETSKSRPFAHFLFGLGIRHVGSETAQVIATYVGTQIGRGRSGTVPLPEIVPFLRSVDEQTWQELPDVGPVVAASLRTFFANQVEQEQLDALLALGVACGIDVERLTASGQGPLSGLSFVLTGTLPTLTREEAGALIRAAGGSVHESVSKQTSYVVAGEKAGSKLARAEAIGVPILGETQLREMLDR